MQKLIKACKKQKRSSQKEMYKLFYSYAMNICLHYARDRHEAKDILNEGFYKVFRNINQYKESAEFKFWLRKVFVNAAIDYHRKYNKKNVALGKIEIDQLVINNDIINQLAFDEILELVQKLSPMYRLVFNLYIMEGHKHHEIAEMLNISEGTSKSNLARAKSNLQKMIFEQKKVNRKKLI